MDEVKLISWEEWCLRNRRTASTVASVPPGHNPFAEKRSRPKELDKLNEATKDELLTIKGIGPKTATAILENAPYESLKKAEETKGISKKAWNSLFAWINSES